MNEVLKIRGFDTSLGIPHFAAIPLTQIPGDPDSIKGNKARGVYWTKPDSTGVEVSRDVKIDESKYSEFIKDFEALTMLSSVFSTTAIAPRILFIIFVYYIKRVEQCPLFFKV